ncbi:MAG: CinA family nicotinamide mononucleotide deamidase-related protein [Spirochaetota bacterium]|nr:MAG: CinA family nicotinamide mononucleotide deamidase-related protein [Spirochaetota bacterium]
MNQKRAHIISIGHELTHGEILNTNALHISRELTQRGIEVQEILTIPDEYESAVVSIQRILKTSGIFIFTGGLGGTRDDITRKIISRVLNKKLCIDEKGKHRLTEWYEKRGRKYDKRDLMQASYPEGGRLLENRNGLAYGFLYRDDEKMIFSLPGVPDEMKWMFDNEVIPYLEKESSFDSNYQSVLLTFAGIPEYVLDKKVQKVVSCFSGLSFGTRAGHGITKVRLESRKEDIGPCIEELKKVLGKHFISMGESRLEEVVGSLLVKRKLSFSVAESCTGGYVSKLITDISGSSRYFLGGVVAYSNVIKEGIIEVNEKTLKKYGAVSSKTAIEMAQGVQRRFGSDISLSVTGVAGPEGGTVSKPVGTVYICVYEKGGKPWVEKYVFPGDREIIRYRTVIQALFMLYTILIDKDK